MPGCRGLIPWLPLHLSQYNKAKKKALAIGIPKTTGLPAHLPCIASATTTTTTNRSDGLTVLSAPLHLAIPHVRLHVWRISASVDGRVSLPLAQQRPELRPRVVGPVAGHVWPLVPPPIHVFGVAAYRPERARHESVRVLQLVRGVFSAAVL